MFEVHSPWPLTHLQDLWIKRIHNSNRVSLKLFCSFNLSLLILLTSNSNVQDLRTLSTYHQLPFMDDGKFHDNLAIIVFSPSSSLHEVWLVEEEDPERFNGNSIYLPVPVPNIIPLSTIWNKCSYKSSFHIIKSPSFFTFPFLYWVKLSESSTFSTFASCLFTPEDKNYKHCIND